LVFSLPSSVVLERASLSRYGWWNQASEPEHDGSAPAGSRRKN
jgi:hypothetical protein